MVKVKLELNSQKGKTTVPSDTYGIYRCGMV